MYLFGMVDRVSRVSSAFPMMGDTGRNPEHNVELAERFSAAIESAHAQGDSSFSNNSILHDAHVQAHEQEQSGLRLTEIGRQARSIFFEQNDNFINSHG